MPCESHKYALMEAAAGSEVESELRSHLAACADCRAAFEQERALYAAIDSGVFAAVNAEVPASLLPRVRAHFDEVAAPRRIWATNWLVWAGAAAIVVVAFFSVRAMWRLTVVPKPAVASTGNTVEPPPVVAPPQNHSAKVELPSKTSSLPGRQLFAASHHSPSGTPSRRNAMPEVLVPHDEEVLLAEYAEQWTMRKHPVLLVQGFDVTVLSPLQVAPIQIEELGVKLLADEDEKMTSANE